jgi:hypothetical protein
MESINELRFFNNVPESVEDNLTSLDKFGVQRLTTFKHEAGP